MGNMKNRTSRLLKQFIAGLSSMAKSKTLALKSKTNAIKARLIIFSLMKNKKFLMSSFTEKFNSLFGGNHSQANEDCLLEDGSSSISRAIVLYNNNAHTYEALPNPCESHDCGCENEGYFEYGDAAEDDDDDKYPDLTHCLFDSEGLDLGGSVIDIVKHSKEEAGQEFKLENEIDQVADLFIKKFRRQMILQKQDSLKRKREQNEA